MGWHSRDLVNCWKMQREHIPSNTDWNRDRWSFLTTAVYCMEEMDMRMMEMRYRDIFKVLISILIQHGLDWMLMSILWSINSKMLLGNFCRYFFIFFFYY